MSFPQKAHVYFECCEISIFLITLRIDAPYRVPYLPVIPTFFVRLPIVCERPVQKGRAADRRLGHGGDTVKYQEEVTAMHGALRHHPRCVERRRHILTPRTLCYREWWLREGQARARGFWFLARVNLKIFLSLVFFWKSFIMFIIYPSCFYSNLTIKLPYNSE